MNENESPGPEPTDCMIDLETLGRRPFCPILSIGAVALRLDNDSPIGDAFYQAVTIDSCLKVGLRIDGNTLAWWMNQSEEARKAAFGDPTAVDLPMALDIFTEWLQSRPLKLWGNSARFDLGILEAAYVACGKEPPWEFRFERCYRTIKNLPAAREIPLPSGGTHHNALDDAVAQALHLRLINQMLQLHL